MFSGSGEQLKIFAGSKLQDFGRNLFQTPSPESPSSPELKTAKPDTLYLHVPFCHPPLCKMCPFCRKEFTSHEATRYMKDLGAELSQLKHKDFSSIYIGGGTPATLIAELITLLQEHDLNPKQLSVEAHPFDLMERNIGIMKNGGVTRLSVGIQSFDADVLRQMGRSNGHNAINNVKNAQEHFEVNADLIYNFAGQTIEQFQNDLSILTEIGVAQITCYPLMAAPGTFDQVDNSQERQFYKAMLRDLTAAGYSPLTPWCFAKSQAGAQGEYISTKGSDQYAGVGISSISKLGQTFTINTFDLDEYHRVISSGQSAAIGMRHLTDFEDAQYFLLTGMFGMSLDSTTLTGNRKKDFLIRYELQALRAMGLLTIKDQIATLTEEGMFFFSQVMKEFYTGLNFYRAQFKKAVI